MENVTGNTTKDWKQYFRLAKLLFQKYGIINEFYARQLECYPIASCSIVLDSSIVVNADEKIVTYDMSTSRFFYKKNGEIFKRSKYSIVGRWNVSNRRYLEELDISRKNLNIWTKELLWENTEVRIICDGREI